MHGEKKTIVVQFQINPTCKVLYDKNVSKNYFLPKHIKKATLTPTSNISSASTRFHIEINRFAIYLSYATLVTYVPVWGALQFQFQCRVGFDGFCSNWFKLVFAHPRNGRTFNQKNILLFPSSQFFNQIFLLPLI